MLRREIWLDRSMSSLVCMRMVLSPVSLFEWSLHNLDVTSALLQTDDAQRNVYV